MTSSTRRPAVLPLLFIPVGAAIGGFVSFRGEPELSIDPPAQSPVPGILIGVLIGAIIAGIALVIVVRAARRRARVFALHPDAVVVEAGDVEPTGAALGRIRGGVVPVGHAYSVAFDASGVHVYHGDELAPIVVIGWQQVGAIREEFMEVSSKPRSALVVEVLTGDAVVELPLVTTASNGFRSPTATMAVAASAIAALRLTAASSAPALTGGGVPRSDNRFATPVRRELREGVPSTRWQAWAKVPPYIGGAVVVIVFASQWFSGAELSRGSVVPAMAAVLAMSLVSLLLFFVGSRAEKAERAAGYTFGRLGGTEVDQVDPKTGYVIRRAGAPQLTKAEESAELQRVRALG